MTRLLACVDFSPLSERVLAEAAALARSMRAELVLLHVARTEPALTSAGAAPPGGHRVPPEDLGRLRATLETLAAGLREGGLDARAMIRLADGNVEDAVLEVSQQIAATYLVAGSHGRSAVLDLLTGSVTSALLRRSTAPVLVVPAHAAR